MTRPALRDLGRFIKDPTARNASVLVGIPSLFEVLNLKGAPYSTELLGFCAWLHGVGLQVLGMLFRGANEDARDDTVDNSVVEEDWRKVSGCVMIIKYYETEN